MTTTPVPNVGEGGFADWPPELRGELDSPTANPRAGTRLFLALENAGTAGIVFTTVEFLGSANDPLPLPGTARA